MNKQTPITNEIMVIIMVKANNLENDLITIGSKHEVAVEPQAEGYTKDMRFVKVIYLEIDNHIKRTITCMTGTAEFELYAMGRKQCVKCANLNRCE